MTICERMSCDELIKVTFHGYAEEKEEPPTLNTEASPDGSDSTACTVGTAWLVQLTGSEGVSFRKFITGSWIFESLVWELQEGLSNARAGTKALRAYAATLEAWADELPPEGQVAYAN